MNEKWFVCIKKSECPNKRKYKTLYHKTCRNPSYIQPPPETSVRKEIKLPPEKQSLAVACKQRTNVSLTPLSLCVCARHQPNITRYLVALPSFSPFQRAQHLDGKMGYHSRTKPGGEKKRENPALPVVFYKPHTHTYCFPLSSIRSHLLSVFACFCRLPLPGGRGRGRGRRGGGKPDWMDRWMEKDRGSYYLLPLLPPPPPPLLPLLLPGRGANGRKNRRIRRGKKVQVGNFRTFRRLLFPSP